MFSFELLHRKRQCKCVQLIRQAMHTGGGNCSLTMQDCEMGAIGCEKNCFNHGHVIRRNLNHGHVIKGNHVPLWRGLIWSVRVTVNGRVAQSEFRKILRFRVVVEKVHSAQPKRFTRRARNTASLKSGGGGGGSSAELCTKKCVDSSKNLFFPRRLKQAIQIRRKRIFRRLGIPVGLWSLCGYLQSLTKCYFS